MKRIFTSILSVSLSVLALSSCSKDTFDANTCSTTKFNVDESQIEELDSYINENKIDAVKHTSGLYYTIVKEGGNKNIGECSSVTVNYVGKLTSGNKFDSSTGFTFDLSNLIPGWRIGLPLIKENGKIILYIPAYLAYGEQGVSNAIPGNAITIFEIEVLKVN